MLFSVTLNIFWVVPIFYITYSILSDVNKGHLKYLVFYITYNDKCHLKCFTRHS